MVPTLEKLMQYRLWIALLAVTVSIFAWVTELADWVYVCPYCRAQRTIIGVLGILLLINPQHWINRWIASTIAALGLVVASVQHFAGWKKVMAGEFEWGEYWYAHPWILSGGAMFAITGLILYLWAWRPQSD